MAKRKRTVHETVTRGARALQDLELSLVTRADKERWGRVYDGYHALDEEQSKLKAILASLLSENADLEHVTFDQIREALAEEGISLEPVSPKESTDK